MTNQEILQNQLRWNRIVCRGLEGTVAHLVFSIEIQSNNLTYQGNPYTKYQQFLYVLIKSLHDKGYGYRRIAHKLNDWGVKTTRGNTWFNTSVSSVLKKETRKRCQNTRDTKQRVSSKDW